MRSLLGIAIALAVTSGAAEATDAAAPTIKNVVIVPGAFVDGSGWRAVHDILVHKGYAVTVAQPRIDTLANDVDEVRELVRRQKGPVVLVGHSYGGAVITQAGNGENVKALVYVAALEPDVGESLSQLVGSMPAPNNDVVATPDGRLYLDAKKFGDDFAGDVDKNRAAFMAASQVPASAAAFGAAAQVAAWHAKPSWAVVTTDDHALSPDLQRWMYRRAGSRVTEIKASHAVYISQPEAVARVIEEAANDVR
ncbi:alpha/beta hydrolase [Dyella solisilvae]|uniref:Alpha/beta hydrolase n=1 Tax=Dyella solisilvae TaxID=1920168 RepID=A0A370K9T6_9GAMM|nr:alpha/beta hydrolase [Dyella solisilvae]RDI99416.1 alpha/beta hydrolase [Dyella solisilvae]